MIRKDVRATTRGLQSTQYDKLLEEFPAGCEGGTRCLFDEGKNDIPNGVITRQAASSAAKRLMKIDKEKRRYHSGYDTELNLIFIRVRPEKELLTKAEQAELDLANDKEEEEEES